MGDGHSTSCTETNVYPRHVDEPGRTSPSCGYTYSSASPRDRPYTVTAAWPEDASFDVIGSRPVRIGADGTALVEEFLPLEVAALKGISVTAATWLIRDIVNLKTRHPRLWFQVAKGHVAVFRACSNSPTA